VKETLKWFDSPWINRVLLAALIWFIQDSYTNLRDDIKDVKVDIGNVKADIKTLRREVELIENFNLQPK
jgi:hypothetical protein